MSPPTNTWRESRNEHRLYAENVTDITTLNTEREDTNYVAFFLYSTFKVCSKFVLHVHLHQ